MTKQDFGHPYAISHHIKFWFITVGYLIRICVHRILLLIYCNYHIICPNRCLWSSYCYGVFFVYVYQEVFCKKPRDQFSWYNWTEYVFRSIPKTSCIVWNKSDYEEFWDKSMLLTCRLPQGSWILWGWNGYPWMLMGLLWGKVNHKTSSDPNPKSQSSPEVFKAYQTWIS